MSPEPQRPSADTSTNPQVVRALSLTRNANLEAKRIKANADLSAEGRARQLEALKSETNAGLTKLKEEYFAATKTDTESVRSRVLGHSSSSDAVSRRDAAARAGQLDTPGEAVALMKTALRIGDDALAKEVLNAAYEKRWADVVNAYGDAHPSAASDMRVLWRATEGKGFMGGNGNIAEAMAFTRWDA